MQVTGTHIHYYFNCHRQLWLFANGINMEHTSDVVYEGKMIHESNYQQRSDRFKEIEIEGIKIDFYDTKNKVIHELKKSSKLYDSHVWQLKYYLFIFEKNGIAGVSGILEYPKERKKEDVYLSDPDRAYLHELIQKIHQLIHLESCPEKINQKRCKSCSYYDFCYANES